MVSTYYPRLTCFVATICLAAGPAAADVVEGFAEPHRTIHIASAEVGVLQSLNVRVGDSVTIGQLLAVLDDDLQRSQLAIAQQQAESRGRLKAAEAERAMNVRRHEKLAQLAARGQASPEETERAKANLEISDGKVLAEQEELRLLQLQLERARLALLKRSFFAPADGVVAETNKHVGEFVSPAAPQVVTIVELDPLAANFLVSRAQLQKLSALPQFRLQFVESGQQAIGTIDSVAPLTDAESGTTSVRIKIANPAGRLRAGERCHLELP